MCVCVDLICVIFTYFFFCSFYVRFLNLLSHIIYKLFTLFLLRAKECVDWYFFFFFVIRLNLKHLLKRIFCYASKRLTITYIVCMSVDKNALQWVFVEGLITIRNIFRNHFLIQTYVWKCYKFLNDTCK